MRYPILALISIGNRPKGNLNCGSPLCDFEVKMDRFQIKQKLLNLKPTLPFRSQNNGSANSFHQRHFPSFQFSRMAKLQKKKCFWYLKITRMVHSLDFANGMISLCIFTDHPRFGRIPALKTIKAVKKGDELFSHYKVSPSFEVLYFMSPMKLYKYCSCNLEVTNPLFVYHFVLIMSG